MSRRTGVKVPNIRYYEQKDLIEPPERTAGNQRRYATNALQRLSLIRHARGLRLGIEDIRELTTLSAHPQELCAGAHAIARAHLKGVRERIARLQKLEKELRRIVACCDAKQVADCRIIEALSDHLFCSDDH